MNKYHITIKDHSANGLLPAKEYNSEITVDTIEEAIKFTKEEYAEALNTYPESIEILSITKFK